mmetsp:Transcript_3216/g.9035  ORF Transcript_3216/g.9035 Transcript_3216/m.9035 type:complete len:236 (-) Transcript_3216:6-713(-)
MPSPQLPRSSSQRLAARGCGRAHSFFLMPGSDSRYSTKSEYFPICCALSVPLYSLPKWSSPSCSRFSCSFAVSRGVLRARSILFFRQPAATSSSAIGLCAPTAAQCSGVILKFSHTCITSAPASMSTLTVAVFGTPAPSITASISGVSPYLSGVLTSAPAPISALAQAAMFSAAASFSARPRTHMISGVWLRESTSLIESPLMSDATVEVSAFAAASCSLVGYSISAIAASDLGS